MSYYFSGPWGDQSVAGNPAGTTGNPIRSRISVKEKGRVQGYEGVIQSAASGRTSAIGGAAVVTTAPLTMSCWALVNDIPSSFGTVMSVNFEPNTAPSTAAQYFYYELGFISQSATPPGSIVFRPRLRSRRVNSQTSTLTIAGVSAWYGPTGGGSLQTGQWVHLVGLVGITTGNARTLQLYVNGVDSSTITNVTVANTPELAGNTFNRTTIGGIKVFGSAAGGMAGCENNFRGYIAEVALWGATLSPEEIQSLYSGIPADRIRPQSLALYAPLVRDLNTVVGDYTLSPESGTTFTSLPVSGLTFVSPLYSGHPQTGITETHPRRYG
jgi:hypothetical protein